MRRDLEKEVVGRRIKSVEVRPHRNAMRVIRRHARRKEFADRLAGKKITKVERKGKYVLLHLDDGEVLVVHFGMSGQFLRGTKRQALPTHTHVVMEFMQGGDLRYVDPRTFGEMFVASADVLFAAGLRHDHMSNQLSAQEVRRLYRAMREVLQDAVRGRGTTLGDEAYVDLFGKPGEFQSELKVYGRKGLPCRRCRTPIDSVKAG